MSHELNTAVNRVETEVKNIKDRVSIRCHCNNYTLKTFGCGSKILNHSIEKWHTFIHQAWLKGFLNRKIAIGEGHNKVADIVFATYTVTEDGIVLLESFED